MELIVAVYDDWGIGKDGTQPIALSADRKFFRETTSGHTIIMGRKTFESLGRVLPNRHHVVLTHADESFFPEEVEVVHSFAEVYTKYRDVDEDVFIIGGGEITEESTKDNAIAFAGDKVIMTSGKGFVWLRGVTSNEYNTVNQLVATRSYAVPVTLVVLAASFLV